MTQKNDIGKTSKHGSKKAGRKMARRAEHVNEKIMRGRDKYHALMARAGIKTGL